MVAIDLKSLVGRMNALTRRQLEAAAGLTLSRTHYNVEIEHVLLKLVETGGSDVAAVLRKGGVDAGRVANEITRALDKFKTGNARAPSLSPDGAKERSSARSACSWMSRCLRAVVSPRPASGSCWVMWLSFESQQSTRRPGGSQDQGPSRAPNEKRLPEGRRRDRHMFG